VFILGSRLGITALKGQSNWPRSMKVTWIS